MKANSYLFKNGVQVQTLGDDSLLAHEAQLVLGFGGKSALSEASVYNSLKTQFPNAQIALCSTAGEIFGAEVLDDSLSVSAMHFDKTSVQTCGINISDFGSSFDAGAALVKGLPTENLRYVLVLSDGGKVNGSELVRGIESHINHTIPVTGGLAGDGANFQSTLVGLNAAPASGNILAIGFYGDAIRIGHGSMGGWEMFGLEKTITKSTSNELFEIDGKNALELYKQYLGNYANELPGSALLFPLSIKLSDDAEPIVRTILSINNETNSMIFAGDVPEGAKVRFMKANFDKLIDAASVAAENCLHGVDNKNPKLALLISCVGRKIILNRRVEEEVASVREMLGNKVITTGFYSYGEISPIAENVRCELHNQTMTITTFDEK